MIVTGRARDCPGYPERQEIVSCHTTITIYPQFDGAEQELDVAFLASLEERVGELNRVY
jgi:hypothetical protein